MASISGEKQDSLHFEPEKFAGSSLGTFKCKDFLLFLSCIVNEEPLGCGLWVGQNKQSEDLLQTYLFNFTFYGLNY